MAVYATDADLITYADDILDHGVASFTSELTRASADVLNLIKAEWWPQAISGKVNSSYDYGLIPPTLDESKINTAELKQITIYRAFGFHIYPRLSKFSDSDGDSFSRRGEFYRDMFKDEWNRIKNLPLYDFDGDSSFEDIERRGPIGRKLVRA